MTDRLQIVILEDVPEDAELVEHQLRAGGIEFVSWRAKNRAEFDKSLTVGHPDVILADYHLPDFDGASAIALARERCPDVPVIIVSGQLGDESAVETITQGAVDYVLKDRLQRLAPAVDRAVAAAASAREQARLSEELAAREARFRSLVQSSFDMTLLIDADGVVTYATPSCTELWGRDVEGEISFSLAAPEDEGRARGFFERALASTHTVGPENIWARGQGGARRQLEIVLTNRIADPACRGVIANMRDVTYREVMAHAVAARDRILETIASIAQGLLSHAWAEPTAEVLARLGAAAEVSRVRLYRTPEAPDGALCLTLLEEWSATPELRSSVDIVERSFGELGWQRWVAELTAGHAMHGAVADLPASERATLEQLGAVSFADVPILVDDAMWGVLALHDCGRPREWTSPELETLRIAADMLGAALVRDRIRGDLVRAQRQASETTMLLEALQETAPVAFGFVDYDLMLVRCNRQLAAISGQPVDGVLGRPVSTVLPRLWPQLETGFRTALNARATVDNIEVMGTTPADQDFEQVWLATFYPVRLYGDVIGVGLMMVDITELREAERARDKLTRDAIGAIAAAVEARDPYTAGHQRRVGQIAELIAKEMGLEPSEIEGIKLAGEIHDIGKVAVPAEILARPGALRASEYELVKIHARAGAEIVAGITFPWPIAEMIGQHHEHYDGSGYPEGLCGDQILTGAHIIHVADVVEAMSSHRPYRPSKGIEDALDTIREGAGEEFEPNAAAACLRIAAEGRFPHLAPDPVTTGPWQPDSASSPAEPAT